MDFISFLCLCFVVSIGFCENADDLKFQYLDYNTRFNGPWTCPNSDVCWVNQYPPSDLNMYKMQSNKMAMWGEECKACTDIDFCGYNLVLNSNNACAELNNISIANWCPPSSNDKLFKLDFRNMIMGPFHSMARDRAYCNLDNYMCNKGKYRYENECRNCIKINSVDCTRGFYPKRCIESIDSVCDVCTYPVIQNNTMYRYGFGILLDDCDDILDIGYNIDSNFDLCAWFMTPRWNMGQCTIECNNGFTVSKEAETTFGYPVCVECSRNCNDKPGTVPPLCSGGTSVVPMDNNGNCISCSVYGINLPGNASWMFPDKVGLNNYIDQCKWQCNTGFYWDESTRKCTSCYSDIPYCNPLEYSYFMNCTHHSRGLCITCNRICGKNRYLSKEIWQSDCECKICTEPILGQSFILKNCSNAIGNSHNTILSACRRGQCQQGYYLSRNCTLYSDAVCTLCTEPINGKLMISPCSIYRDTQFVECPVNYSCNGSMFVSTCPADRRALNGLCVCPNGMMFSDTFIDTCVPYECKNGEYVEINTGRCRNCSIQGIETISPYSNKLIMGIDACYCPPSYFIEFSANKESIRCWPCGDLNCRKQFFEIQQICSGMDTTEPICTCIQPPGFSAINKTDILSSQIFPDICKSSLTCFDDYYTHSDKSLAEIDSISHTEYAFWFKDTSKQIVWYNRSNSVFTYKIHSVLLLDETHVLILLEDSRLALAYIQNTNDNMQWEFIDLSVLKSSFPENILTNPKLTSVKLHDRKGEYMSVNIKSLIKVWVSFSYEGICENEYSTIVRPCSTMQLLIFFPRPNGVHNYKLCYLDLCFTLGINFWGASFSMLGINLEIKKLELGNTEYNNDQSIYLWLTTFNLGSKPNSFIGKYELRFNDNQDTILNYDDSVKIIYDTSYSNFEILDFVSGVRGLYMLTTGYDSIRLINKARDFKLLFFEFSSNMRFLLDPINLFSHPIMRNALLMMQTQSVFKITTIYYNYIYFQESNGIGIELWNRYLSTNMDHIFATNEPVFISNAIQYNSIELFQSKILYRLLLLTNSSFAIVSGIHLCEPDTLHNSLSNTTLCSMSHCLRKNPCGPNTYRQSRTHTCYCMHGYAYIQSSVIPHSNTFEYCRPCQGNENKFCPGGLSNGESCPKNAITLREFPTSINDCHCLPGYFAMDGICIECIKDAFCPFNGTKIPMHCHKFGMTSYNQRESAIHCYCPTRTFGFACTPCKENEICKTTTENIPLLMYFGIQGYGVFNSLDKLHTCIDNFFNPYYPDQAHHIVYTIPEDYSSFQLHATDIEQYNRLFWNWLIVVRKNDNIILHTVNCMKDIDFKILKINTIKSEFEPENFKVNIDCGILYDQPGYWEWNGERGSDEDCVCIAGHEPISPWNLGFYNLPRSQKCFPCLNGTHRSRHSKRLCIPCADTTREYAPYVGMDKCICKPDYMYSNRSGRCELYSELNQEYAFFQNSPSWYTFLSNTYIAIFITLSIVVGISLMYCIVIYILV